MGEAFWLASWSEGAELGDNRDAVRAFSLNGGAAALLAIADGASATLYSGSWAQVLVDAAITSGETGLDTDRVTAEILRAKSSYDPPVGRGHADRWQRRKWERYGSQSTLLAARAAVVGPQLARVEALAVGDSVLIVVGADSVASFPVGDRDDFGRRPELVSSLEADGLSLEAWRGSIQPGDVVLGASDGVARPLLERVDIAGPAAVWQLLLDLISRPGEARQVLVERLGARDADGTLCLEDDASLAACIYLPAHLTGHPTDRARALVRQRLGGTAEVASLFDSAYDWLSEKFRILRDALEPPDGDDRDG